MAAPDPFLTYVAIETFAAAGHVVHRGDRRRGNHPSVIAAPQLFLIADADDDEIAGSQGMLQQEALNRRQGLLS